MANAEIIEHRFDRLAIFHGNGGQLQLGGMSIEPNAQMSDTEASIIFGLAGCSVASTLLYVSRHRLQALLPIWLSPFAAEECPGLDKRRSWTHWTLILAFLCMAGLILSIIPICLNPQELRAMCDIIPWLSAVLITALDRPTKTPRILLLQYLLIFSATMGAYSSQFLQHNIRTLDPFRIVRAVLALSGIVVIGNMPIRNPAWDKEDIGNPKLPPSHHVRSPEDNLSLFRFWAMTWVYPLARICRKKEITVEDVWQLPLEFQHTRLYMAFRELQGNLLPCLLKANGLDLSIATVLGIAEKIAEVSNIRLTSRLYRALDNGDPNEAYFWCAVMLCVDFVRQIAKTTSSWYSRKAYERSRGETFIALFGKLLTRAVPGSDITDKSPDSPKVEGWKCMGCCGGMRKQKKDDTNNHPLHPMPRL